MSLSNLVDNVEDVIFKERDENNSYDDLIYAVIEELHQRYGYAKSSNSEYKQCENCINYPVDFDPQCVDCNNYSKWKQ